LTTLAQVKLAP